jgi:hypothetical protein
LKTWMFWSSTIMNKNGFKHHTKKNFDEWLMDGRVCPRWFTKHAVYDYMINHGVLGYQLWDIPACRRGWYKEGHPAAINDAWTKFTDHSPILLKPSTRRFFFVCATSIADEPRMTRSVNC